MTITSSTYVNGMQLSLLHNNVMNFTLIERLTYLKRELHYSDIWADPSKASKEFIFLLPYKLACSFTSLPVGSMHEH